MEVGHVDISVSSYLKVSLNEWNAVMNWTGDFSDQKERNFFEPWLSPVPESNGVILHSFLGTERSCARYATGRYSPADCILGALAYG
jgi:hypothetical protein